MTETSQQANSARAAQFLEGPILRSLLKLSVPIILANILQAAYQIIDAFWVGRLGGAAVAAVSVSIPVSFLTISLGVGLAVAGSTLIAQYFGAGDHRAVDHVASQTLLMIVLVSIVLGAIGYALSPLFLKLLGIAPDVYDGALGFMRVSFIGLVFNFAFFMFQSIMRGVGVVTMPVYIVLGTVIFNFALDPLFIYGWGPIPASGVTGAALATLSTQSVAAIIGFVILFRGRFHVRMHVYDLKPDWAYIRRAFRLGLPASVEQSGRALGLTVMTFLITSFGTLSVAAYGVGSNVLQVVMIPAMGLSMAISTLVGQNIGAGKIDRAERIAKIGSLVGFVTLEVCGVIVFAFAPAFVRFFVPSDPHVIDAGAIFLRTMALAWGFIGLQFCLTGVLRASGNMVATMVLTLVSQWVLQFPLAYVLSKHTSLGIDGVWWSIPVANVAITLATIVVFARGTWKQGRLVKTADDDLVDRTTEDALTEEPTRVV